MVNKMKRQELAKRINHFVELDRDYKTKILLIWDIDKVQPENVLNWAKITEKLWKLEPSKIVECERYGSLNHSYQLNHPYQFGIEITVNQQATKEERLARWSKYQVKGFDPQVNTILIEHVQKSLDLLNDDVIDYLLSLS